MKWFSGIYLFTLLIACLPSYATDNQSNFINIQNILTNLSRSNDGVITLRDHRDVKTTIQIQPTWRQLVLTGRVNLSQITPGKKSWETARISILFRDANKKTKWAHCPSWHTTTNGWVEFKHVYVIPKTAKEIMIGPAIYAKGQVQYANLRLQTMDETAVRIANTPEQIKLWGTEPVEIVSPTRSEICLNGVWQFTPALNQTETVPQDDWGYIQVPGSWRPGSWRGWMPGVVSQGTGIRWENFGKGRNVFAGWYQRSLDIPSQWANRTILLDFARVSTDAIIMVDGKNAGKVSWPAGIVDITNFVTPGKPSKLQVLVIATLSEKETITYMGPNADQIIKSKAKLDNAGLIDDVILKSRPKDAFVNDVFVITSTRDNTLKLEIELTGLTEKQDLQFIAQVLDESGKIEKTFKTRKQVQSPENQKYILKWQWNNPRLWDIGKPNLYTLMLKVQGRQIDDVYRQRFGFREFWIDGKRFILNGKKIRLRPTSCGNNSPESVAQGMHEMIDQIIKSFMSMGFNIGELWPHDHLRRGFAEFRPHWYERADEHGFALMGVALSMSKYAASWNEPGIKDAWNQRMQAELKRVRNHPSVLIWSTSPNRFGHSEDQNPALVGHKKKSWIKLDSWRKLADAGEDACKQLKAFDPTRPVLIHAAGPVGDIYNLNNYLNFIPLQERMQWLSEWQKTGDMPLTMIEFGTPLLYSFFRQRSFSKITQSEPLMTEFCATYLGPKAYQLEQQTYRDAIGKLYNKADQYKRGLVTYLCDEPAFQNLQKIFIKQTWRSWRTWGISGGMIPWSWAQGWNNEWNQGTTINFDPFKPGRRGTYLSKTTSNAYYNFQKGGNTKRLAGDVLTQNNGPTLAWIAGKPKNFTEQSHHFLAGKQVTKQAVMLNDLRNQADYKITWQVQINGKKIAQDIKTGTLATAQTLFFPIHFNIPIQLTADKVQGKIELTATIDGIEHHDIFSFHAFTPAKPITCNHVYMFDPVGKTTVLFKQLGLKTKPWKSNITNGLLVIGQNALVATGHMPEFVEPFVKQGGRVLMMAQDPQWVRQNTGLRVGQHMSRYVFPIKNHPMTADLQNDDLRDWAGESHLQKKAYSTLPQVDPDIAKCPSPTYGWRWGSQGAVSSCAIEKPHHSRWRPILECEFDLAYTPLMELDYGKGRLIWCSLDLEDQVPVDPAAHRIAHKIIDYAANAAIDETKIKPTMLLGDTSDQQAMQSLGLNFINISDIPTQDGLLVIGSKIQIKKTALIPFINRGGKVLFLHRQGPQAPLGVTLKHKDNFCGSTNPPAWNVCRGLSASDLRWRAGHQAWVFTAPDSKDQMGANGLLLKKKLGQGTVIFTQINPDRFDTTKQTYFRYTRWRQTRALSQLLANLGATFKSDALIFSAKVSDVQTDSKLSLNGSWQAKITDYKTMTDSSNRYADQGLSSQGHAAIQKQVASHGWQTHHLPSYWNAFGGKWSHALGEAVFRKEIQIPKEWMGQDLTLHIGAIDDVDDTYFNGIRIGKTDTQTPHYYSHPRVYTIPKERIHKTKNVIAIRVFNNYGDGGIYSDEQGIFLQPKRQEQANTAKPKTGYYHWDYREDFSLGDDPYRYKRW